MSFRADRVKNHVADDARAGEKNRRVCSIIVHAPRVKLKVRTNIAFFFSLLLLLFFSFRKTVINKNRSNATARPRRARRRGIFHVRGCARFCTRTRNCYAEKGGFCVALSRDTIFRREIPPRDSLSPRLSTRSTQFALAPRDVSSRHASRPRFDLPKIIKYTGKIAREDRSRDGEKSGKRRTRDFTRTCETRETTRGGKGQLK